MDPLDDLINEAFAAAPLPHRSWTELRAAMSDVNHDPLRQRVKAALTAIEGRGLDLIAADIRALLPPEGGAVVTP